MKISILTPDISHNCIHRSYILAQLLSQKHKVEIIGPRYGDGLWYPLRDMREFPVKSVKADTQTGNFNLKLLTKLVDGDIIYACKPYFPSYGIGLMARIMKHRPLLIDLDDYDLGFGREEWLGIPWWKRLAGYPQALAHLGCYQWVTILDKLVSLADGITVASKPLQEMYGGTLIRHAVNTDISPIYTETSSVPHHPVIGFIGTVRPHKGVGDLIKSLFLLRHKWFSCIISDSGDKQYIDQLKGMVSSMGMNNRIKFVPPQYRSSLWDTLSHIDIIVIPSRNTVHSYYQVPAKLFDAMNAGKLIVATDVGDIKGILGGCGIMARPSHMFALTLAIESAINAVRDKTNLLALKEKARERCIKEYDIKVIGKKLNKVIASLR